jgi:hypothetical protein
MNLWNWIHSIQKLFSVMGIFEKKGAVDSVTPADPPSAEKTKAQRDVEQAREVVEQHPPLTIRRFMAIFSLGCLLAAAQIPHILLAAPQVLPQEYYVY